MRLCALGRQVSMPEVQVVQTEEVILIEEEAGPAEQIAELVPEVEQVTEADSENEGEGMHIVEEFMEMINQNVFKLQQQVCSPGKDMVQVEWSKLRLPSVKPSRTTKSWRFVAKAAGCERGEIVASFDSGPKPSP